MCQKRGRTPGGAPGGAPSSLPAEDQQHQGHVPSVLFVEKVLSTQSSYVVGLQISSVDEGCLRRVLGWEHKGICEEPCPQLEQDAVTWRLAPGSGQRDPPHGCGRMTPALPIQALLLTGSLPLWVHRNVSFL